MTKMVEGIQKGDKAFQLCGEKDCCPVLNISGNEVVIKDDFGGTVKMSLDQLREIKKIDF